MEEWGNNPETERWMDERNNKIGREIGKRVKESGGSEQDLAKEVKKSLDSGELVRTPYDPRRTYEKHRDWDRAVKESKEAIEHDRAAEKERLKDFPELHDVDKRFDEWNRDREWEIRRQEEDRKPEQSEGNSTPPTTPGKQSSILDGIGDTLGAVGSAATVDLIPFDTAMDVDKDTLVHMAAQAASGGKKASLAQAAQIAMAQTLSRMHGLVMQEVERQQGDTFRMPGITGPIPEPDGTTREAIERTINDPANAGIFNTIGSKIERIVQNVDEADPTAVLVNAVMETLRKGDIKIQPRILLPDIFPQDEGPAREPKGERGRVIDVAGISIPIRLPEVKVVMDEASATGIDINHLHRGEDGAIRVKSYTRSDGVRVRGHTRSAPDGNLNNNLR